MHQAVLNRFLFFFYLGYLAKNKIFQRIDKKFLFEGPSYSICDCCFGCIQQVFDTQEKIEIPQEWATALKNSHLRNIEVHWVTLDMLKDYKSLIRMHYLARNEDVERNRKEVRKIAEINFGYVEIPARKGNLHLVQHDTAWYTMDSKERPKIFSFWKKKKQTKKTRCKAYVWIVTS